MRCNSECMRFSRSLAFALRTSCGLPEVLFLHELIMLRSIWCLVGMIGASGAWNLATVDDTGLNFVTNNNDYVVLHVSVFYVRSFLAIQNRWNATTKSPITLIESTWPENLLPIQPRVFPNDLSHAKSICDCNGIIQSIYTAIDRNGMLWLIDNGSIYCPPKLIIYNLLKLNAEVSVDPRICPHAFGIQFLVHPFSTGSPIRVQ